MERRNGKSDALRDSLLEAASAYRYKREKRKYRGIGRVLVAKLVVESKNLGAEGRLLVRSVQGSTGFPFLEATKPLRECPFLLDCVSGCRLESSFAPRLCCRRRGMVVYSAAASEHSP